MRRMLLDVDGGPAPDASFASSPHARWSVQGKEWWWEGRESKSTPNKRGGDTGRKGVDPKMPRKRARVDSRQARTRAHPAHPTHYGCHRTHVQPPASFHRSAPHWVSRNQILLACAMPKLPQRLVARQKEEGGNAGGTNLAQPVPSPRDHHCKHVRTNPPVKSKALSQFM